MGTPESQREYGPSWADVREHILEVRKAHNKPITVQMSVVDFPKASPYLYIQVQSYFVDAAGKHQPGTAKGHQWPAGDWRSMPAMILALLFQLDEALTDWEKVAERQAQF